ncbi:MAG: cell surface protein SprA [Chitinophagaceae bacterium]|nr:cell surface protein SprA [Chitinophagaceae bacterium]
MGVLIFLFCDLHSMAQQRDSLHYPISDRRADGFSTVNKNPFSIRDTSLIKQQIEYDPKLQQYVIVEKIGNKIYRTPTTLSFEEFWRIQSKQSENNYFKKRADALAALNEKTKRPPMKVHTSLFDRIFGVSDKGMKVDIRPSGEVNVMAGYQGQNIKNPTLPERARKNGGFDFDMNANLAVNANIGEKLKFPLNYNTQSNLGFDNQIKLDYKGKDDEIIKSIEAGNISYQSRGTLIPSTQNLFGIKTQLQFGKVFITGALANQRSQKQSLGLQGGAATQSFQKRLDDYEENRHFLVAQYFKNNFNKTMSNLPVVNTQVQVQRIEVWVTNRNGATTDARDIVGFMDLAEPSPYNPVITSLTSNPLPFNGANNLYSSLVNDPTARNPSRINSILFAKGLRPVDDYEKTFARKLSPNEYYFNPQAGFVSVNSQLQSDEVLAVAYQYTYNGKVYQVGEFSQDVALDSTKGVQKVLMLKLLKATSQRIELPLWGLMMKNVYSLDMFGGIQREDFKLNVLYEEPSGGLKRYLPETSPAVGGQPLLRILNLDRLNSRNDPQPDGVFDYVEGFTILPQLGRVVFPVLEPFGRDLEALAFNGMPAAIKKKYVFYQLYDSIKAIAQTYANLNRFVMQGTVKSSGGSEISLNTFNIPQGSVSVTAGGQILREGMDYVVDYNLGTVKILNQAILSSNVPVKVNFENNAGFGMQQRGFAALRLDYIASKKLSIGTSMMRLGERPFFTKMGYGEDPIRNTMYGLDFSYKSELPGLTRFLNRLPYYNTKAKSFVTAYGEAAILKPGHPPQIGKGNQGLIYIDDFEASKTSIDLRFPFVSWALASTPQGNPKFPEAVLSDSIDYNFNRAKLAWYNIEPNLQDKNSPGNPLRKNVAELSDPRVRQIYTNELFPQRTTNITDVQASTFDLAYYPTERGPYNFESRATQIDANGKLKNPANRWGGLMRAIDQTDFETGNVEFIEFWIQDPFIKSPGSKGGKMYLNFGNVSEDILKDGKRFYENGMNTPTINAAVDSSSTWGRTPVNPIQITQAFSNDPNDRAYQDVGLDGLDDAGEKAKKGYVLDRLAANFGTSSPVYQNTLKDPSSDNYKWYRDQSFDAAGTGILGRYKNFNNPQGNSPIATTNGIFTSAATLYPDNEDLNRDNTLNETEAYYEYEIELKPGMDVGLTKYITDKKRVTVNSADGIVRQENWFLFRVPIKGYSKRVGGIPDFKSIRFMRMYLSDFEDSVVLRFARMDLVRNQWRQFTYNLDTTGSYTPINTSTGTSFNTLSVNLEENSSRQPVNYLIPPGIERVQQLSNNGINLLQNEQSISLQLHNLFSGDSRAIFKTMNLDMRQYGKLSMFIHAESVTGQRALRDGDINAVIRIGQDFLNNYYEIKIPLNITAPGTYAKGQELKVWPAENNLDFSLRDLIDLKLKRNAAAAPLNNIFREVIGNKTFSVMGNPNLGEVRGFLIAIENPYKVDGPIANTEVWVNELRLSEIDEHGGWAALGRVDFTLADLGSVSVSANTHTQGFGTIEQRVNERARENLFQFDAAANINAGKLVPKEARLSMPIYASISRTIRTPQYDPYDKDILYSEKLLSMPGKRDSIRNAAVDQTTIKTINFTNVRVAPAGVKTGLFKLSNFDFSYSYTQTSQSSPVIQENKVTRHRGGLGYTYIGQSKYVEPLKRLIRSKSAWLAWLRDFNFNLHPSLLSFRADVNRQFGEYVPRIVNTYDSKIERVDTTYDKYFTYDRFYNMQWDLSRKLNFNFTATNNARVDEPSGRLDTKEKRDSVRSNFINGGRNTLYQQRASLNWDIPLSKLPITDWISARYSYSTSYNWIGASRVAINLGNTLENSQENNLNTQFNFGNLYAKSKWYRAIDNIPMPKPKAPATSVDAKNKKGKNKGNMLNGTNVQNSQQPNALGFTVPTKEEALKGLTGKLRYEALLKWRQQKRDERTALRIAKANEPIELNGFQRGLGKFITMVKTIQLSYSANFRSRVPGYMDSSKILGQNWGSMQPGLDYIFGRQPDTSWLNKKYSQGLITKDSTFNYLYRQNFEQKLGITAQIEPIRELLIDINLDKSFTKEYSELYKDTAGFGRAEHLNPLSSGGFSVSYIAFNTLFGKQNPNEVSQTFKTFEANRLIISNRVASENPYWQSLPAGQKFLPDGYARGYNRYSQDVILPAFFAAYTGKDPLSIALLKQSNANIRSNPFSGILPKPNWRMTYTGLTKIPALASIFSAITISHGYNGTLSMNSYTSALLYRDPFRLGAPSFIDTVSGNYIPYFLVPNITMQEQFVPLIGVEITTNKKLSLKFEYKKSRTLSMSLIDYQLSESRSTEWTFGGAWRKRGVNLPFKLPGMKAKKLSNDLNLKLDLSVRDVATSNSRLDQSNAYGTGGQKEIMIQPAIDYVINNRINIKFFFDQRRVIPYISTSAPITNTRAGVNVRISLAQ